MSLKPVSRGYYIIIILLLSGLGMFSVWLRQLNYGVGLSPDPVHLISIVDSLTKGGGLVAWDGRGFNPVFPFTLSVVSSLGILDVFSASTFLNVIIFGLSISISIVWVSDKIRSRIFILYMGVACAFSPLLGNEHATVLTEPLFNLFVVTSLFTLDKFLNSDEKRWLILSAVFAALSILTRHMGISLIFATLILLALRDKRSLQRIKYAVIYLVITVPVIGVYILRNFLRYGQLAERQWQTGFNHSYSIDMLTSELMNWTFTNIGFEYLEMIFENFDISSTLIGASMLIMVAFFGYILVHFQREKRLSKFKGLATPIVFILVYVFLLYFSLRFSNIGSIGPRYLSPIYIPMIVIFAVTLDRILGRISSNYILPFIGLVALWLTLLAVANYSDIKRWLDYGYDRNYYSSSDWRNSETINYLKSNPIVGQIHSNEIRAVYAHMRLPNEAEAYFTVLPSNLPEKVLRWEWSRANNIDMYIVWFYGRKAYEAVPLNYDFMSLGSSQNLQIVAVLEDGIILKNSQKSLLYFKDLRTAILEDIEANILNDTQFITANPVVDIYLSSERLVYISTLCNNRDIESPFFLHIYPVNRADILESHGNDNPGFNNYDFSFHRERFLLEESCVVIRNLPDYNIKMIKTGQFSTSGGELWVEELQIDSHIELLRESTQ